MNYRLFRLCWAGFVIAATTTFLGILTGIWPSPGINMAVKILETLFLGTIAWVLWTQLLNRDLRGRRKPPRP